VSVGAVYRRGTPFGLRVTSVNGPHSSSPGLLDYDQPARFHVPTSYGAGIAYRLTNDTQVSFDCDRVLYSVLTRDFITFLKDVDDPSKYRAPNGTEIHLGLEHFHARGEKRSFVWRIGGWRDPDHHVRYEDPSNPQSLLFRPGQTDWHVSAGFGAVIGRRYQADVGFDHSRRQRILSVSFVTRFGGE